MTEKEIDLLQDWIDQYGLTPFLDEVANAARIHSGYDDVDADEWITAGDEIEALADALQLYEDED